MRRSHIFLLLTLAFVAVASVVGQKYFRSRSLPPAEFAGTEVCGSCHQQEYERWSASHHRHAMEAASPGTVRGDFRDAQFRYGKVVSRFFTRDDGFYVTTDNSRGEPETFRIAYTFGYFPLQQYLVQFPDGRMQALSIAWDARPAQEGGQKWFHLYPGAAVSHDDALHWTGAFQNWNSRCASCHSTGLVKGYDRASNRYQTQWREVNVGCEACHGMGSRHVAWAKGDRKGSGNGLLTNLRRTWAPENGVRPIPTVAETLNGQLLACAGCHSRRTELASGRPGSDFLQDFALSPVQEGLYFADGQIQDEVYEIGSFLQSRMHQNHVSCSNCHDAHSGKPLLQGNALCLQCHERRTFETRDHALHDPSTPGGQCVNCHMPQRTYMGVHVRHDHSLRIPDPVGSRTAGAPDACLACHRGKDSAWVAQHIPGQASATGARYPHAPLLAAARGGDASIAPQLLDFARDGTRPVMLRAAALMESARFPSPAQVAVADEALRSPDALVRAGAVMATANYETRERVARLAPVLRDPVRSVRIAAARQLVDVEIAALGAEQAKDIARLMAEYRSSLEQNADLPEGATELALFEASQGRFDAADSALAQALKLSPRYLPALMNRADLYRAQGRDDLAEPLLRDALSAYPESADPLHALGLLYVRTGRARDSVALFRRAARLAPQDPAYRLVYALSLIETGSRAAGIAELESASRQFPGDAAIRAALDSQRERR